MLFPPVKERNRATGRLAGFISSYSGDSDTTSTDDDDAPPTTDAYVENYCRRSGVAMGKGLARK